MPGFLFVVSGPSGVGKTVLCDEMLKRYSGELIYSISATSRKPRGTEKDGREYFFYSREQFEQALQKNQFAEWAMVHDNYYGTPKSFLNKNLEAGKHVLLNIDVQGAAKIRQAYPQAVLFFILPPSMEALEARLRKRNVDSDEVLQRRLANAKEEISHQKDYHHVLTNDDLNACVDNLAGTIDKYIHSTP